MSVELRDGGQRATTQKLVSNGRIAGNCVSEHLVANEGIVLNLGSSW
jgi:hypothetical protein